MPGRRSLCTATGRTDRSRVASPTAGSGRASHVRLMRDAGLRPLPGLSAWPMLGPLAWRDRHEPDRFVDVRCVPHASGVDHRFARAEPDRLRLAVELPDDRHPARQADHDLVAGRVALAGVPWSAAFEDHDQPALCAVLSDRGGVGLQHPGVPAEAIDGQRPRPEAEMDRRGSEIDRVTRFGHELHTRSVARTRPEVLDERKPAWIRIGPALVVTGDAGALPRW